jgi:hypothetical protein
MVDGLVGKAPRIEPVDHLTSHVLGVGESFFRIMHSTPGDPAGSELLVYDHLGVVMYRRISALSDPHGFAWTGEHIVVPNTQFNQLVRLTGDGVIAKIWHAPTSATVCWHINGVDFINERLVERPLDAFRVRMI